METLTLLETAILTAFQSVRVDGLTQIVALISALGNKAFIWLVMAAIMLFFADKRTTGLLVIVTIGVAFVGSELVLEPLVARVRPCDAGIGITAVMGVSHNGYSFPSGHALSSFAAATVLALTLGKRWGVPAFVLAVLIALSRLYLGVHYPTDVLAGALIGALIGVIVVVIYNNFFGYRTHERNLPKVNRGKGMHSR